MKTLVGEAALEFVVPGSVVGVGTGSTVNKFIDALASMKQRIAGAVSSSAQSTARLQALGVAEVFLQDTPPDTIVAGVEAAVAVRRARF